jgi:hypothetical protein
MRLIFLHLVPKSKPGSQAGQARLTWSIPALSAVAGARFRCPDPSNRSVYFSLVDQITKKVRFLVGDMSVPVGWTTIEYYMGENTVHHAPTHLGPASS